MLEKDNGHPVSPMHNRGDSSLNLHPKEADDLLNKYNILFPFPVSPKAYLSPLSKNPKRRARSF